ncbi:uncharacterized protein BYT42DRAFT_112430 [Radiomyces spectabilis]|uniref:uncharacterized protein n=1 Tax=Radiomyces spectabilis TaxID=64574 RepID=UPI0022209B2D|nr:uncharacterized protein BYT42DRAFT_112430 [Radiomyces spectabilis]KAI8369492.1 hypothetical protein BYT42DRAFT_112430 [Radiomyces spectabilis]
MSHSPASEEKKALLRKVCADALRVMPSHTPVTFNGEPSYATFLPPTEILKNTRHAYLSFEKRPMWQPIPEGAILDHKFLKMKHHVVPDPTWVPPVKERPPPSPVFPRSRGIKLRDVDTIIKEDRMLRSLSEEEREAYSSSRKPQQQGPSQPPNKPPPLPKKPDPVMDIINEITAASRHLSSAPHPSTTKSSIPSSSNPNNKTTPTTATVTTPIQSSSKNKEDGTPRKKSNSTTSGRPTTSGKGVKSSAELSKAQSVHGRSTPEQRKPSPPIYSHISLHDLLIARDFMPLHMDDPVVNRKLSQLKEKSTTKNKPKYARPILRLHVKLKVPEAKRSRSKETLPETQTTPLRSKKSVSAAVESEREDDTMATKAQPRAEISRERSKSAAARDRSMERSPDAAKQSITRKPSPRKPSPVPHRAVKKESTPVSGDMTSQDDAQPPAKWSLPTGTIPTEFIRSMKIPKRTRSEPKPEEKPSLLPTKRIKEQEVELEEGETISPSPSPMGPIAATTTIEVPLDTKRRRQTTSDREMPRHRSSRKDSHDRKESRHRGGDDRDEDDRRRHSRKESRRYDDDRLGDDRRKAKRDSRSLEEERYDDDRRKLHRKNSRSYDDDDKPDRSQRRDSRHSSSSYTEKSRRGGAGMSPIARSPSVSRKLSSTSSSESNHRKTPTADTLLQRPSSTSLEGAVSPNLASQKLSPMTGSTVTPDTKDLQKGLSMSPRHGSKDLSTKPSSTVEPDQHSSSEKATPPVPAPSTHASSTTHLSIDKAGASSSVSSQSPTPHHSYLNATAPDAESPSQLKMYSIM